MIFFINSTSTKQPIRKWHFKFYPPWKAFLSCSLCEQRRSLRRSLVCVWNGHREPGWHYNIGRFNWYFAWCQVIPKLHTGLLLRGPAAQSNLIASWLQSFLGIVLIMFLCNMQSHIVCDRTTTIVNGKNPSSQYGKITENLSPSPPCPSLLDLDETKQKTKKEGSHSWRGCQ